MTERRSGAAGSGAREEAPSGRMGDRLEQAIQHHADLPAELERAEQELDAPPKKRGSLRRTAFWLVVLLTPTVAVFCTIS